MLRAPTPRAAPTEIRSQRATAEQLALARVIIERSNVARATAPVQALREVPELMRWLRSPGHRANLLEPAFTTTGVGVARSYRGGWYIVQLYVLPPAKQ